MYRDRDTYHIGGDWTMKGVRYDNHNESDFYTLCLSLITHYWTFNPGSMTASPNRLYFAVLGDSNTVLHCYGHDLTRYESKEFTLPAISGNVFIGRGRGGRGFSCLAARFSGSGYAGCGWDTRRHLGFVDLGCRVRDCSV